MYRSGVGSDCRGADRLASPPCTSRGFPLQADMTSSRKTRQPCRAYSILRFSPTAETVPSRQSRRTEQRKLVSRNPLFYPRRRLWQPGPLVRVLTRQRYMSAVIYRVLPSSPQATFAVASPVSIRPSRFPSGAKIWTPPGPVANRFPLWSIFIPSGRPGNLPTIEVTSANTRPLPMVPSAFIGYAIQIAFLGSDCATYRVFSSGENAIPFG